MSPLLQFFSIILGIWSAVALFVWVVTENFEALLYASPLVIFSGPAYYIRKRLAEHARRRYEDEQAVLRDYLETLQLIGWRPRELSAMEQLQEELEIDALDRYEVS